MLTEEEDYYDDDDEMEAEVDEREDDLERNDMSTIRTSTSKVVNLHTSNSMKVVIVEPKKYEEVTTIADHLKQKKHEAREKMNDIKDYRNNELKNYVIGNIVLVLYFSGIFDNLFLADINSNLNIWKTLIESALVSSIIYIYVFLLDSLIPGDIKQKMAYFHIGKLPGYTIFTKMKQNNKDDRFTHADIMKKYASIYNNMPAEKKKKEKYENAEWYKLYNNYKNESKILIANRDFLLCRDITIITIMLIIIYLILVILKIIVFSKNIVVVMLIELIVSNISMRGKAKRLAYNVISEDIYK